MKSSRFLYGNGVVSHSPDTPPVSTFLESHPGAYTTTRTHNHGAHLLFWERHVQRLTNSFKILLNSNRPQLLFGADGTPDSLRPLLAECTAVDSAIRNLVNGSVGEVLAVALRERGGEEEELAVTTLVSGSSEELFDVRVHVGGYAPPVFGARGARLALVGPGRDFAEAKHTDWVRLRKRLEKFRPASVTELLLSNDGDRVLEGCVTNFFVVCRKDNNADEGATFNSSKSSCHFEVQTAPVKDGVLPGVVRQVVIEVCLSKGISVKEVMPSWSHREFWHEAFITSSLRIMEHVEKILVPCSWESLELKPLDEILWDEKQFGENPGMITAMIQKEIMEKAGLEMFSF